MKHTLSVLVRSARRARGIAAVLLGSLFLAAPAHAYLDPGTGSMIVQIILGGIAGLAIAGKLFWSQIANFFRNFFTSGSSQQINTTARALDESNVSVSQTSKHNDNKR